jgi:multiple antibiotic resistance protein
MLDLHDYLKILVSLLVITDPIGAIPLFVTLTSGRDTDFRRSTIRGACLAVAGLFLLTILVGPNLLAAFSISVASFRIGGGILLLIMAVDMLVGRPARGRTPLAHPLESEEKESIGIVPLAIPYLAGPGAISALIIYRQQSTEPTHLALLIAIALATVSVIWLVLTFASHFGRLIGPTGISIAVRILGLILAAISVEFITSGLLVLLPGLAR